MSSIMMRLSLLAFWLATLVAPAAMAQRAPEQVTVPLLVQVNRPYIEVTFTRPNGTTRKAQMLLDTGGGGFLMTDSLARDLGLSWGERSREEGHEMAGVSTAPTVTVGDFPLRLDPKRVFVVFGSANIMPVVSGGHAEGIIPGHVLSQYHVVFDYPAGKFILAQAGILTPQGTAHAMPLGRNSGFPRTEIIVDGKTYGMLLDTGASFTMVSADLLKALGDAHSDWKRYPGAFGDAKTLGGSTLETMFIPHVTWMGEELTDAGVTSQRKGVFETYMSGMMAQPIMGSLAGNVLKGFRVELDYPNQKLYLSRP
jgi:predicted aspartyl protease